MSNRKSPKPIFSPEIILEYHDRLIKAGINPTSNNIVKLIKKHENLKIPRTVSKHFPYPMERIPLKTIPITNPITVSKLLPKLGLNNDVEKKIAEIYQRLLIENVILQEEAFIKDRIAEAEQLKAARARLRLDPSGREVFYIPRTSSSSSRSRGGYYVVTRK